VPPAPPEPRRTLNLRADHVSGIAFVLFGLLIFATSTDLPMGSLSFPGSGFLPRLLAGLMIILGLSLALRARESEPFASLGWTDLKHAGPVMLITALAIVAYTELGFIISVTLLIFALLIIVERRRLAPAAIYAVAIMFLTYAAFDWGLKTPLPTGPFGY
jgi:hypothetical protein